MNSGKPESNNNLPQTLATQISDRLIKKVTKGGGIVFVGQSIGKVIHFLLYILLGRFLGAGGYGLYSLGLSVFQIGNMVSMLGMEGGIVRFVPNYQANQDLQRVKGTLISALLLSTLISIVIGGMLFLSANFWAIKIFSKPDLAPILRIFSVALPFYVIMTIAAFSVRALEKVNYETGVRNILFPVLDIFLVLIAFALGYRLKGAICGFLGSSALSAILGLYLLRKTFSEIAGKLKAKFEIRKLLRFVIPLLLASSSYLLIIYTDKIMLGYFSKSEDLGIYTAAFRVVFLMGIVPQAFKPIYAPTISSLYSQGKIEQVQQIYQTTTRWFFIINLLVLLLFVCFSDQIMGLFGQEFRKGGLILVVLGVFGLLSACTGLTGTMIAMIDLQDFALFNNIGALFINIGLNIFMIMHWGALGAAIATGITKTLVSIAETSEIKVMRKVQPFNRAYFKPIGAFIITFVLFQLAKRFFEVNSLWMIYALGAIICYSIIVYLLRLQPEEKTVLKSMANKLRC